ncbi:hypothetical protein N7490_000279 [Penicillium lividum]|nr:hypothetical protein N7490_000279 [Penicillium lividum]
MASLAMFITRNWPRRETSHRATRYVRFSHEILHPDRAAHNGLSSVQDLEAKRDWARVISSSHELDAQTDSLARVGRWELWYIHEELEHAGLSVVKIVEVQAKVHPLVVELTGKMTPKNRLERSLVSIMVERLCYCWGRLHRCSMRMRLLLIRGLWSENLDEGEGEREPQARCVSSYCFIQEKASGENITIEKHVDHAVGSLERPMMHAHLKKKFVDQDVSNWPGKDRNRE